MLKFGARMAAIRGVVLLLALAPTADAASPSAGALYGGGEMSAAKQANNLDVQYTSIRVAKSGKTINFYAEWQLRCPGKSYSGPAIFSVTELPVKADGSFSGQASIDGQGSGGSQTGSVTFAGRFGPNGVVRGTGRGSAQLTLTDGSTVDCSKTIRWTAIAPEVRKKASPFATQAIWYGTTNQTYPFMIRTAASGRSVPKATLEYDVKCTKQTERSAVMGETIPGPLKVKSDGRFRGTETFEAAQAFQAGTTATVDVVLSGRFGAKEVTGSWRIKVTLRDPNTKAIVDTCDSGSIRFRADR